ncbi:MAG: hypothetical protein ACPGUY_03520 [Akkermansiaceae bacterium]
MITPEETLDHTLQAVREQKQRRKERKKLIVGASCILIGLSCFAHFQPSPPSQSSTQTEKFPADTNSTFRIEISHATGDRQMDISPEDLAKIVYRPGVTFELQGNTCIWKKPDQYVCLSMPTPEMELEEQSILHSTPSIW